MKVFGKFVVAAAVIAVAACDSATGVGGAGKVTLSFTRASTSANQAAVVMAVPLTFGGHTIDLTSADVTFSRIRLKKVESDSTVDEDDRDDSDEFARSEAGSVKFDSATISLPLAGGIVTPISAAIPVGDYRAIEMGVASVRLKGTYDGNAFDVVVPVHFVLPQRFSPPIHVASESDKVNVTITVDALSWLRNENGTLIDPRLIPTSPQLAAQVAKDVRTSFRSFRDRNHNARDDDNDEHLDNSNHGSDD